MAAVSIRPVEEPRILSQSAGGGQTSSFTEHRPLTNIEDIRVESPSPVLSNSHRFNYQQSENVINECNKISIEPEIVAKTATVTTTTDNKFDAFFGTNEGLKGTQDLQSSVIEDSSNGKQMVKRTLVKWAKISDGKTEQHSSRTTTEEASLNLWRNLERKVNKLRDKADSGTKTNLDSKSIQKQSVELTIKTSGFDDNKSHVKTKTDEAKVTDVEASTSSGQTKSHVNTSTKYNEKKNINSHSFGKGSLHVSTGSSTKEVLDKTLQDYPKTTFIVNENNSEIKLSKPTFTNTFGHGVASKTKVSRETDMESAKKIDEAFKTVSKRESFSQTLSKRNELASATDRGSVVSVRVAQQKEVNSSNTKKTTNETQAYQQTIFKESSTQNDKHETFSACHSTQTKELTPMKEVQQLPTPICQHHHCPCPLSDAIQLFKQMLETRSSHTVTQCSTYNKTVNNNEENEINRFGHYNSMPSGSYGDARKSQGMKELSTFYSHINKEFNSFSSINKLYGVANVTHDNATDLVLTKDYHLPVSHIEISDVSEDLLLSNSYNRNEMVQYRHLLQLEKCPNVVFFVKTVQGRLASVSASELATVAAVKEAVSKLFQMPKVACRLKLNGKELAELLTVRESGITSLCTVELLLWF